MKNKKLTYKIERLGEEEIENFQVFQFKGISILGIKLGYWKSDINKNVEKYKFRNPVVWYTDLKCDSLQECLEIIERMCEQFEKDGFVLKINIEIKL